MNCHFPISLRQRLPRRLIATTLGSMKLLGTVSYRDVHWGPLIMALLLTGVGLGMVVSATLDPSGPAQWGREAKMQSIWWALSFSVCIFCLHVPPKTWSALALPIALAAIGLQLFVLVAAGSSIVPYINGQANWIVLGPLRLQPGNSLRWPPCSPLPRWP